MGGDMVRTMPGYVMAPPARPLVSVVMAVCNGERWLTQALESITGQTFSEYECIIIDDGSTDGSLQIALSYANDRVRVIENGSNRGLAASLNLGMRLARGRYLVRMDADDLCLPTRFERQVAFMEANPQISAAGCWVETIGSSSDFWRYPVAHEDIRCELLFGPPLVHPAMILRRDSFLAAGLWYDESFRFAQDYDLWERAAKQLRFANQPEILLRYRIHDELVRSEADEARFYFADLVRERQLKVLHLSLSERELRLHLQIARFQTLHSIARLEEVGKWFAKLVEANESTGAYEIVAFRQMLARRWATICLDASSLGLPAWRTFRRYVNGDGDGMPWIERFAFLLKCCGRLR